MSPTDSITPATGLSQLQGRAANLAPFGWTPRQAEWIALVCFHSGCFFRSQMAAYANVSRQAVSCFVHSLIQQQHAVELTLQQAGTPRLCRISRRSIYRALGAEYIRYRPFVSRRPLLARILALDYVLEHPLHPWLLTEHDKLDFFHRVLKIPEHRLPSRVYQGHAGGRRRYFPTRFPIGVSSDSVTLLYVDPGDANDRPLRRWASDRYRFFASIREAGYQIHLAFVSANTSTLSRRRQVLENWTRPGKRGIPKEGIALLEEIESLKTAILQGDPSILDSLGRVNNAMNRRFELEHDYARLEEQAHASLIDACSLWHATRLADMDFERLDLPDWTPAEPFWA